VKTIPPRLVIVLLIGALAATTVAADTINIKLNNTGRESALYALGLLGLGALDTDAQSPFQPARRRNSASKSIRITSRSSGLPAGIVSIEAPFAEDSLIVNGERDSLQNLRRSAAAFDDSSRGVMMVDEWFDLSKSDAHGLGLCTTENPLLTFTALGDDEKSEKSLRRMLTAQCKKRIRVGPCVSTLSLEAADIYTVPGKGEVGTYTRTSGPGVVRTFAIARVNDDNTLTVELRAQASTARDYSARLGPVFGLKRNIKSGDRICLAAVGLQPDPDKVSLIVLTFQAIQLHGGATVNMDSSFTQQ
jgi:hypothetical protein